LVNSSCGATNGTPGASYYGVPGFSSGPGQSNQNSEKVKPYPSQPPSSNPYAASAPYSGSPGHNPNPYFSGPGFNPNPQSGTGYNPNPYGNYPNLHDQSAGLTGPGFFPSTAPNLQSSPHEHPPSYDEATKKRQ